MLDTADADESQFGNMENEENKEEKASWKKKRVVDVQIVFEVAQVAF